MVDPPTTHTLIITHQSSIHRLCAPIAGLSVYLSVYPMFLKIHRIKLIVSVISFSLSLIAELTSFWRVRIKRELSSKDG